MLVEIGLFLMLKKRNKKILCKRQKRKIKVEEGIEIIIKMRKKDTIKGQIKLNMSQFDKERLKIFWKSMETSNNNKKKIKVINRRNQEISNLRVSKRKTIQKKLKKNPKIINRRKKISSMPMNNASNNVKLK